MPRAIGGFAIPWRYDCSAIVGHLKCGRAIGDAIPRGKRMKDSEKTSVKIVAAAAAGSQPVASVSPAFAMIDEGNALQEEGRIPEAMARYEAAIDIDPQCARAHLNCGNIFLAAAKFDEARSAYQLAIACDPRYAAAHFNMGNLNFKMGEFELALRSYQEAVDIKPDFADAWVAMANAFDSLGRAAEAVERYQRALLIIPDYAEVHFNLGSLAMAQGRHDLAVESLLRAFEIKPEFAQARHALCVELRNLEDLDVAEAGYRRALAIEPESEQILHELAMILAARGKAPEALQLLMPAVERGPTWAIKIAFAAGAARLRFKADEPRIRAALKTAIAEPWGMPFQLCLPALSLILHDRRIANCVSVANASWPTRVPKAALFGADGLNALAEDSLLHAMLEAAPARPIEFERFLTCARYALLETALSKQVPDLSDIAALGFYAALSQQCFVNEYIFDCDDREMRMAVAARTKLLALLDGNAVAPPFLLLAVAAYFSLYTLRGASQLLDPNYPAPIDAVLRQQIREPLEEQALRAGITCLTPITEGVSEEVRSQYEHNPYPRWVKLPRHAQSPCFNEVLRSLLPFGPFNPMTDDCAPEALIAGCGTGSHPIQTTQRFRGVHVLAIDLSLSSISYAKRKTQELGITNIEYAQADILNLGGLARTFDIIESVGVLHHLADPFAGWRSLLSLLRPRGFMLLGFYSELARRDVVKARELIAAREYSSTADDIRRFRRDLDRNPEVELQNLSQRTDFYSTSECRDLLFHVQEHRLTIPQIQSFLGNSGLHFVGFELDRTVLEKYRARFPNDPSCTDLGNWASFEADNADTFAGMYVFWIQKPK
jgi:tetratricopeptide (TPR) repeat protein/2-polyprenyl-3-methyl-5-hydroxy-6-metoxy-1,4-benzoquinol methylase